jgi:hypothetical protein
MMVQITWHDWKTLCFTSLHYCVSFQSMTSISSSHCLSWLMAYLVSMLSLCSMQLLCFLRILLVVDFLWRQVMTTFQVFHPVSLQTSLLHSLPSHGMSQNSAFQSFACSSSHSQDLAYSFQVDQSIQTILDYHFWLSQMSGSQRSLYLHLFDRIPHV